MLNQFSNAVYEVASVVFKVSTVSFLSTLVVLSFHIHLLFNGISSLSLHFLKIFKFCNSGVHSTGKKLLAAGELKEGISLIYFLQWHVLTQ